MRKRLIVAVAFLVVALAAGAAATAVAQGQRFPDVPPDHYAYEAVEWAAEAGVTTGYTDGTFKPERPLIKRHAVVFMERYYDEILQAEESEEFTRADMMVLLKAINDGNFRDDTDEDGTDGDDGTTTRPFISLAAGYDHSCAIRADQTLACWGNGADGQTNAPAGQYTAVSAGERYSCAIRADDGTVDCWGRTDNGRTSPPEGEFTSILSATGTIRTTGEEICRLRPNAGGGMTCTPYKPSGAYTCGYRPSGAVECWGQDDYSEASPTGQYTSIALGIDHACGIATDKTVACWGKNTDSHGGDGFGTACHESSSFSHRSGECGAGRASPPAGQFTSVTAGQWHSCALGVTGVVACWGSNRKLGPRNREPLAGQANPPTGQFTAITAGVWHTCGIRADQTIACWGDNVEGQLNAPNGRFSAFTAGAYHTCGFRVDGTIACWGWNAHGQASPPVA